jgi:hypothetical protein
MTIQNVRGFTAKRRAEILDRAFARKGEPFALGEAVTLLAEAIGVIDENAEVILSAEEKAEIALLLSQCAPRRKGARGEVLVASTKAPESVPPMSMEPTPPVETLIAEAMQLDRGTMKRRQRKKDARERFERRMRKWAPPLRFALRCAAFVRSLRATLHAAWAKTSTIDGLVHRGPSLASFVSPIRPRRMEKP